MIISVLKQNDVWTNLKNVNKVFVQNNNICKSGIISIIKLIEK